MPGKRWVLGPILTLFATASIAISSAPPASAVTRQAGTVTVTPSQNLADPALVRVSWSGIPNSSGLWYLFLCGDGFPSDEYQVPNYCSFLPSGQSPQDVMVGKGYTGQGGYQCPPPGSDTCSVVVMAYGQVNGAYHYAIATIHFSMRMTLTPTYGPKGTSLKVYGIYFKPGETVTVKYKTGLASPRSVALCSGVAGGYTSFTCTGTVPAGGKAGALGAHAIVAKANSGKAKINYTLTT